MKRMVLLLWMTCAAALLAGAGLAGPGATNPFAGDAAAVKEGEKIFDRLCVECHLDGTGGSGPNLTDDTWTYGGSDAEVFETVAKGRRGGMPSWSGELKDDDIWNVIAYVRTLKR